MSTGTDVAPGDLVGLLAEATERGASLLAGGDRLAGPAAVQDDGSELVCGDAGSGALGVAYPDGTRLAVCLTAGLATELCGGTSGDQLTSGLQVVIDEISGGLGQVPTETLPLAVPDELTAWFGDATVLLGAGIFEGDDVVATIGAAGGAPTVAPATAPVADEAPAVAAPTPDPAPGPAVAAAPTAPAVSAAVSMPAVDARNVGAPAAPGPVLPDDVLARGLALLSDVHLSVSAELGRTRLRVSDLLAMEPGAVIGLEREAGSPIDLLVNGTLFARAEVIVVDDCYAARITELVGGGLTPGAAG